MPGSIPRMPAERAHLLQLLHLLEEVVERELALEQLLGGRLGLVLLEDLLGLLDQREHVAHAEDAAGHPVGVELLERVELLARGREGDRPADDLLDADSAAPPRASPSSFDMITPSIASVWWNASATPTAS